MVAFAHVDAWCFHETHRPKSTDRAECMCLNGTNAKADVTFGTDDLMLQAKAVPESVVQETSEPRCHL